MIMIKRIISASTGQFIRDDVLAGKGEIALDVSPAQGFYWPRWDGKQWVEGKTTAEIAPILAAKAADELIITNETDIRAKLQGMIAGLETDLGKTTDPAGTGTLNAILNQTNALINANAATYIKALAHIVRSNQRADIRAIRLILRNLTAPDTE